MNLEPWRDFKPNERTNDHEYNTLLHKFRSLYSEVKEFQERHAEALVDRSISATSVKDVPLSYGSSVKNSVSLFNRAINNNNNNINSYPRNIPELNPLNISHQISPIRSLRSVETNGNKDIGLKQGSSNRNQLESQQHYTSSYNLCSPNNSVVINGSPANISRPEARQRNQATNHRLLLSKSSERLDTIINNNIPSVVSRIKTFASDFGQTKVSTPIARNTKQQPNDSNIYDAVSPDDTSSSNPGDDSTAASAQNINRLPLNQRAKLESSKSVLGLSGQHAGRLHKWSPEVSNAISSTKSTPNGQLDICGGEHSFDMSMNSDITNHSSSSLTHSNGSHMRNADYNRYHDYCNYVNIDYFLKRTDSSSHNQFKEDEDVTNEDLSDVSDEDTTQRSHSSSSDQNCASDLGNIARHLDTRKLSRDINTITTSSTDSITPASSGDLLGEPGATSTQASQTTSRQQLSTSHDNINKLATFLPPQSHRDNYGTGSDRSHLDSCNPASSRLESPLQGSNVSYNHDDINFDKTHSSAYGDSGALIEAQNTMRSFLGDLNLSTDDAFEDNAQRRIVKESFAVEYSSRRKLRHLFLFNDVIVCAKYQASPKQKFTFDVKWYLSLNSVSLADLSDVNNQVKCDREVVENQILAIRTSLMLLRGQMQNIKRGRQKQPSKVIKKLKKKRTELEAELVLLLPHLPLVIKHLTSGKKYTFFLSSNFDRNQWIESIKFLQSQLPPAAKGSPSSPSSSELQAWIQTCRKNLNPSLGTFLMRSNCDDDLLYGDLYITLCGVNGISKPGHYHFCFEVDSYGHFSQKASSVVLSMNEQDNPLKEEYIFPLDGAHSLRIILYEDLGKGSKPLVVGKAHVELSRSWISDKPVEKVITFNSNCYIKTKLSYSSSELLSMRVPHAKLCPTFGMDIMQVCKKEKTNVPMLVQLCVNEVERRGMREVGIYRIAGPSTDIQRLKKAFETNPYVAELLLRDIDINSVTGFLKTYLREMPEGLFSNKLYPKFVEAFKIPQKDSIERTKTMLDLFHKIPVVNQNTIIYLVEHLVNVGNFEAYNKMSLTNLATILGPNISKPPPEPANIGVTEPFSAVVIGSMSQAGILYFFLNRKASNLPLTELDPSELNRQS